MCLNETYSTGGKANICLTYYLLRIVINKVMLYRHSFSTFLQCAIRRVHVNKDGLKLNGTHQLLVNADDVNILDRSILTVKKTEALVVAIKEVGQYVNADKTKCMVMSRDQNAGRSHRTKTDDISFEIMEQFRYLGSTVTNQNFIQEEIKCRLNLGNACYHSVQNLLSSSLLSKNIRIKYT